MNSDIELTFKKVLRPTSRDLFARLAAWRPKKLPGSVRWETREETEIFVYRIRVDRALEKRKKSGLKKMRFRWIDSLVSFKKI